MGTSNQDSRIQLLDFFRGFALLLIVLIHYVEHFDFFAPASDGLFFSNQTDQQVMSWVFALISGKAYSIFALLFGYSFFIQINRKEQSGEDFRARYLWRLWILFIIGFAHSLLYKGDILHIYAALGVILIALYRVTTPVLIFISVLLALQIPTIYRLVLSFIDPNYTYQETFGMGIWHIVDQTYAKGSLAEVIEFNLWQGRTTVWGWTYYNGRYLQLISLFVLGLVLARYRIFENIQRYQANVIKLFIIAAIITISLKTTIQPLLVNSLSDQQSTHLNLLLNSYYNLAFTGLIAAALLCLYLKYGSTKVHALLAAYGRMSLTNYLVQAVFGVWFFYGFGLAMYQYVGTCLSLMCGLLVFLAQSYFSLWWQNHYRYGPMEWVWRKFTYLGRNTAVKREKGEVQVS